MPSCRAVRAVALITRRFSTLIEASEAADGIAQDAHCPGTAALQDAKFEPLQRFRHNGRLAMAGFGGVLRQAMEFGRVTW